MSVIYKYPLKIGLNNLLIPCNHKILSVQSQNNYPCIWILIEDLEAIKIEVIFKVIVTGYYFNSKGLEFIGTVLLDNDSFVAHIFQHQNKT